MKPLLSSLHSSLFIIHHLSSLISHNPQSTIQPRPPGPGQPLPNFPNNNEPMVSEETFTLDEEEVRKLSPRSSKVGETMEVDTEYSNEQREATARKNCCWALWDYDGICEARGYALLALGRGVAVMSNGAFLAEIMASSSIFVSSPSICIGRLFPYDTARCTSLLPSQKIVLSIQFW